MTREEAKHIVDVAFSVPQAIRRAGEDRTYYQDEISEAKNMAIQALSQEPCDDAISRDAVIDALSEYVSNEEYEDKSHTFTVKPLIKRIVNLPSVTQKCEKCAMNGSGSKYCDNCRHKSGKWISRPHIYGVAFCSECGYELKINNTNYCPNCGAKMVEPQESESDV